MNKKERYFILGLLLLAVVLWGVMTLLRPTDYGSIQITMNGEEY